MDTSLAEEVQQTMATLAPNRFFFMSPYRSFTTRSEEHTSELQSPSIISYAVFCLKKNFF